MTRQVKTRGFMGVRKTRSYTCGYWEERKNRDMYKLMAKFARHYADDAHTAIDVGCFVGGFICDLDWIESRTAYDLNDWSKN